MIIQANTQHIPLADESVHCVITSPPYYAKRVYEDLKPLEWEEGNVHLGHESNPNAYITNLVRLFRGVRRVLRPDGTLWVNISDTYAGSGGAGGDYRVGGLREGEAKYNRVEIPLRMKPKDMMGIPWMFALAMREDGWWLRSEVIWAKGRDGLDVDDNFGPSYPSSAKDRPQLTHESLFLFTKSRQYSYDYYGSRVAWEKGSHALRSVWIINPRGNKKKLHTATYPVELVDQVLKTVIPVVCGKCGAPLSRIVRKKQQSKYSKREAKKQQERMGGVITGGTAKVTLSDAKVDWEDYWEQTGWENNCGCPITLARSPIILDPFSGSGTTSVAAIKAGFRHVGLELSGGYCRDSKNRVDEASRNKSRGGPVI
jgi:DNA modification methylase